MTFYYYLHDMWQLAWQGDIQGLWFFAAVYTFLVCSYSAIFQLRIRRWPCLEGRLISQGLHKFGATEWAASKQDYLAAALYRYEYAGIEYAGSKISPWLLLASHNARFILNKQLSAIQYFSNGRLKVFFNPKSPSKSYLILPSIPGIAITLFFGFMPILCFGLKFYPK